MKALLTLSFFAFSLNAHSFTTVILNKDVPLKSQTKGNPTHWSIEGNGTKYCYVRINSTVNQESSFVQAGTSFEVSEVTEQECEWNYERSCKVSVTAVNKVKELSIGITCIEKSMIASKITPSKATKFTKGFLTVK